MIEPLVLCARRARVAAWAIVLSALPLAVAAAETADEFVARLNKEFDDLSLEFNAAGWVQLTYINADTELLAAKAMEKYLGAVTRAVAEAKEFEGQPMSGARSSC